MKRSLRWLVGVSASLILILLGLILARDPILKVLAARGLEESTGLRAEIGEIKTMLGSGAFHVRDLKLYNRAQFGSSLAAYVRELVLDLDAEQATEGIVHVRNLTLNIPELNVVRSADGRLNLDGVEKAVRERLHKRKKKKGDKFELDFGGIDRLELTLGKVCYTDLEHPGRNRQVDLAVSGEVITDLKTEEDLQRQAGAMLFRFLMMESIAPAAARLPIEQTRPPDPSRRVLAGSGGNK